MGRFKRPTKLEMKKLHSNTNQRPLMTEESEPILNELFNKPDKNTLEAINYNFMASSSQDSSSSNNIPIVRKSLDATDISDTENDIFNTVHRRTPLRRESFEIATKSGISAAKRISISSALKQQRLDKVLQHRHENSSTSSVSSSIESQNYSFQPALQTTSTTRMLSQIKPDEIKSSNTDDNEFNISKNIEIHQMLDSSNESDSSTDSGLLKRNLELLKKKVVLNVSQVTLDNSNNSNNSNILDNTQESKYYQNLSTDVLSGGLILPNKPTGNKIKFIKKITTPKSSPVVQLVRGPDIIETIETTTSMSFIMNKNVKLTYEEKRVPAANSTNSEKKFHQKYEEPEWNNTHSTPIPITIQSRSKSEPRLAESESTRNT